MADPLAWVPAALSQLEAAGLRRRLSHRANPAGPEVDGLIDFSSNDYLGLAGDPRVGEAAADAARRWGAGAGASRLITGGTTLHRELETAIADWKGTDDAVVFSSGYLANAGVIPALVGRGDLLASDALNHASIIDACRLSRAEVGVYAHRDLAELDRMLAAAPTDARRLVVTDGVFSMDGDAADLPALCDVAEAHGAMVMVDDAHGCGVVGPDGRGTPALAACEARVHIQLGTLSKAFGSTGGYIAVRGDLAEWLRNRARGFVYDTAPTPAAVGGALEALRIARVEPWRREHATALARHLADELASPDRAAGDADSPAACIVPWVVGETDAAVAASAELRRAGLLATAIRPPTVPDGGARLRFAVSADHTGADVTRAVEALTELSRRPCRQADQPVPTR
jgi:8-amino-7-oxononanoate synthase